MTPEAQRIAIADRDNARNRLRSAVRYGKIKKPSSCSRCGKLTPAPLLHGHHHKGYEQWHDVMWLCSPCHDAVEPDAKKNPGLSNGAYTQPHRRVRGETHGMASLTQSQVDDIRSRPYYYGIGRDLAIEFGVSQTTVGRVRKKASWI